MSRKILYLIPYLPVPPTSGGTLRIFHILKHLQAHYDVTVAGYGDYGDEPAFYESFPALRNKTYLVNRFFKVRYNRALQLYSMLTDHSSWYIREKNQSFQRLLNKLFDTQSFDIVHAEFPPMANFQMEADVIKVMDAHNVEYDNLRRMSNMDGSFLRRFFYNHEYLKLFAEEMAVCRNQDAIFTTSERDSDIFGENVPGVPRFVVPNGVDTSYFKPLEAEPEPYSLVFTGTMKYIPNYDGVIYFLNRIYPEIRKRIPQTKIYVVGNNPPKSLLGMASDNIIVTGFVEDVRPYIQRASVYVVPLRMGGGTRLKVLEALSMKKAIVTTSIGSEGIDVINRDHVLMADDPVDFAESVVQLFKDRALARRMGVRGREFVSGAYDWKVVMNRMDNAYNHLETIKNQTTVVL